MVLMRAGRPPKKGLSYHSSDVDYYEDYKIMALMDKYGPLGQTVYDVIVKMVYRNGYYLEIPMDKLALSVIKTVGNKWIRNKGLVLQVVQYCSEIGLFDDALLQQSVITSAGIQKRYALATVRNKVQKDKYWLLGEESGKPLLSAPKNDISATETDISVTEIQNNDAETPIKEIKENNTYITFPPELEREFQLYLLVRANNYGEILPEQVQALREDLLSLSPDRDEQIAIVKKATAGGYKSFFAVNGKKKKEPKLPERKKGFNNFQGRDYTRDDYIGLIEK
mgnify:CR=1 FL=1